MQSSSSPLRILLTGGAGFIGSRLAYRLAEQPGAKLLIVDCLHPQVHGPNPVLQFPRNVELVRGDICQPGLLDEQFERHDPHLVVHLAAETGTGQSADEISRYCDVNVLGTARLLEAARRHGGSLRRLVLPSSRAVYGEGAYLSPNGTTVVPPARTTAAMKAGQFEPRNAQGELLKPIPTSETLPPAPASIYASTKLMQEYLVTQAGLTSDWQATILRLQNVYGPGQSLSNPYTGVLSIFTSQLLAGDHLNIFEDGQIVRDFVFVDDVVAALEQACLTELPHATVMNIGTGSQATILDVAKTLMRLCGRPQDSFTITGDFRAGDIRHAVADIRSAKENLDWQPRTSLDAGLTSLVQWATQTKAA